MADVNEHISTKRPNEEIDVKLKRGSKMLTIPVKLSKKELLDYSYYGFELEELNDDEKRKYGLNEGVKIKEIKNEKFMRYANRLRGSIILKINGEKVTYIERVTQILGGKSDDESIEMEVYMRDGTRASLML
jgi:S1-C subfamily serine protease